MSFEEAALMLAETASGMSKEEFEEFAGEVLEDNTPDEIATIAAYLPPELQVQSAKAWAGLVRTTPTSRGVTLHLRRRHACECKRTRNVDEGSEELDVSQVLQEKPSTCH